ncbi:MAG TPA: type VI secretion system contractile sheath small subunit [Deltaproteobacteria bacterium]|jgi:type VI secretion system protein ImpB|nr:type VI secretion system contractile sheath small subunit [Deltaproteobacteria bacterium]
MAKEASVAPKERINIVYKPATNMDEDVELPLKLVVIGDFTGREDSTALEDRKVINIDKDNFNQVLGEQRITMSFGVRDRLTPNAQEGDEIPVNLEIQNLKSFQPEQVVNQVPELKALLEIRDALVAMKGPLGNVKAFSQKLKQVLADDAAREKLMRELKLDEGSSGSES